MFSDYSCPFLCVMVTSNPFPFNFVALYYEMWKFLSILNFPSVIVGNITHLVFSWDYMGRPSYILLSWWNVFDKPLCIIQFILGWVTRPLWWGSINGFSFFLDTGTFLNVFVQVSSNKDCRVSILVGFIGTRSCSIYLLTAV